jgi:hypothetical protein
VPLGLIEHKVEHVHECALGALAEARQSRLSESGDLDVPSVGPELFRENV